MVVRRVTIQIAATDVRAAYLRAAHLLSQAQGEYVQDSALTGSGTQVQANLTLRVAASRLPEVLDQLRGLGKVDSEQAQGEDVTEQVVDTDARLRNEQHVETELLKLLESRQNAPLTEILQLRDKLSEVRNSIERLTAQRERLGGLVDLATVLVIIRPDTEPPPPPPPTNYFVKAISAAWERSLRFLADTVATLLSILVGGIIWWALLVVLIAILVRHRRRRQAE
ncbi:MAG: DUF4349 domain-containing protein [Planctomycetes bacterium]|nr:DUF4349 domain-containing protein [Planctomycetota bacterium]